MNNEKYIGIIMNKKEVTEGVYIYFPDHITDGYLVNEDEDSISLFEDTYSGIDYLQYNDPNGAFSSENVVAYLIKESVLLEQEEGLSLSEAKQEYFDDAKEYTLVGFYIYNQEKIEFLKLGISEVYNAIKEFDLNTTNPFEFISGEKLYNLLLDINEEIGTISLENKNADAFMDDDIEELSAVAIPVEDLDRLLELDANEIKQDLIKMRKTFDIAVGIVDDNEVVNSKDNIIKKIESTYKAILDIEEETEMKKLLQGLVDMYTDLVLSIDNGVYDDKTYDKVTDFFYKTIDIYEDLMKIDDIDLIKEKISDIKDSQRKHIESMDNNYIRDYYRYKKREEELNEVFGIKDDSTEKQANNKDKKVKFSPKEMKEFFDKRIIGQEEAKIDVISAVFMNSLIDDPINKNSCLLIGPTGSGKTLIAESVSEFLDLPFVSIDTTQLTQPGYVGADIEDFLARLISSANGDLEKAQKGIVLLDEIDKKGTESNSDVSGRGVLNTLLPFLGGTTYTVTTESSYGKKKVQFDTSRLTIFATGAFTEVAKQKNNGSDLYGNNSIGFTSNIKEETDEDIKYHKFTREDLKKYGNMPDELLGRFSTITQLNGHTKESLIRILLDSNISNLKKEKEKLETINIELSWTDDYLDKVASHALKLKTGARSLKSAIEESIKKARWEAINNMDEISGIVLNGESVSDASQAVLVYKDGCTNTVEEVIKNKKQNTSKVLEKVNDK